MPGRRFRYVLLLVVSLCALPTAAEEDAAAPLADWTQTLKDVAATLAADDVPDKVLPALREKLETTRRETRAWLAERNPILADARKELAALGPAPAEGAEPEAEGVATQRKELSARLATLEGSVKEAEEDLENTR